MYAVVQTGGKQYRVNLGDKLRVEKLDVEAGAEIALDKVLMMADEDGNVTVGAPLIDGVAVGATVLSQGRGEKIRVYKFKRRKKYRRTQGHRQSYTELQITSIGGETVAADSSAQTAAPANADADKLTRLDGVGPAMETKLNAVGISTFAHMAALDADALAALADQVKVKPEWVDQAKELV